MTARSDASFEGSEAVVFGGSGFMGAVLVDALVGAGAHVVSFDLRPPAQLPSGVVFTQGDITDAEAVARAVEGADHVLALAGGLGALRSISNPSLDLATSCVAQVALLEAVRARAPQASVVFAGSRLEYGPPLELPVDERHVLQPETPYAIHKAACSAYYQAYARLYGLHATVLRLPNPYGAHVKGAARSAGYGILNLFVDTALSDGCIQLYGGGTQLRDFVHVDDVASAALRALLVPAAAGEVFNIGSGEPHSLREAAEIVLDVCGTGSINSEAAWPEIEAVVETGDFYFDISKADTVLGWRPTTTLRQGLVGVVSAMRDVCG